MLSGFSESGLFVVLNLNEFLGRDKAVFSEMFANHYVFFPFSHSWANVGFGGIAIPRLIGIYREAGMAQIFFFTSYFLTYITPVKKEKLVRVVLFAGSLLTFSTAGLLSFVGGFLMLKYYPSLNLKLNFSKILIIFFVLPVIVLAVLFTPDIGVVSKLSSESGQQRTQSYEYSWQMFKENPFFGRGYYAGFEKQSTTADAIQFLGLIGVLYQIGLVGIILYFLPWAYAFYNLNDKNSYFVLMPCFLTLLFSQPSYNDMFVWFLLLIDFKQLTTHSIQTKLN